MTDIQSLEAVFERLDSAQRCLRRAAEAMRNKERAERFLEEDPAFYAGDFAMEIEEAKDDLDDALYYLKELSK